MRWKPATLTLSSHAAIHTCTIHAVGSGSGCILKVVGRSLCLLQPLELSSSGSAGEGKREVERGIKEAGWKGEIKEAGWKGELRRPGGKGN